MIQDMSAKDTDMIRQLITGYQVARALLAADEIGLLEHIQNKPLPITQLAERTRTHGPTMKRFIRALRAVELVSVDEDGLVTPGPLSDGLRNAARIGIENYRAWSELPYTLRTGKPAFDHVVVPLARQRPRSPHAGRDQANSIDR